MDKYEPFTCCICGAYFETQFGNNPNPKVRMHETNGTRNTCCDDCNFKEVLPLRKEVMRTGEKHPLWKYWKPHWWGGPSWWGELTEEERDAMLEKMHFEIKIH